MTSGNSKISRGKKERFLRYVLRRRPCGYILLGNILALVLFTAGLIGLFIAANYYTAQNRLYHNEEEILDKFYGKNFTFGHCRYKSLTPKWNTELCEQNCGPNAFSYRNYELDTFQEYDKSCIDKMDVMFCHENFSRQCIRPRSGDKAIKSCFGFEGVNMWKYTDKKDPDAKPILVNAISVEDLETKYKNQNLLSNELVVQCPQCAVITTPFYVVEAMDDGTGSCYRVLETEKEGWPHFGRFCDSVDSNPNMRDKNVASNSLSLHLKRSLPDENSRVMTLQELKDKGVPKNRAGYGGEEGKDMQMDEPCVAVSIKNNS